MLKLLFIYLQKIFFKFYLLHTRQAKFFFITEVNRRVFFLYIFNYPGLDCWEGQAWQCAVAALRASWAHDRASVQRVQVQAPRPRTPGRGGDGRRQPWIRGRLLQRHWPANDTGCHLRCVKNLPRDVILVVMRYNSRKTWFSENWSRISICVKKNV